MGIAARKVCSGSAVVGHEQGVTDKYVVIDFVANTARSMAGRAHHLDCKSADEDNFAILQETVELSAISFYVLRIEDRCENLLHVLDMFANRDLRARGGLEIDRC